MIAIISDENLPEWEYNVDMFIVYACLALFQANEKLMPNYHILFEIKRTMEQQAGRISRGLKSKFEGVKITFNIYSVAAPANIGEYGDLFRCAIAVFHSSERGERAYMNHLGIVLGGIAELTS